MSVDLTCLVGGEAGQGVQSTGFILSKVLARGGYHIFADQDYESRVRGGHNFFRIRITTEPIGAIAEKVNILLALDEESIHLHQDKLSTGSIIIYDEGKVNESSNYHLVHLPLKQLAEDKVGNKLMANTVALGAIIGLIDYDLGVLEQVLKERFSKDSEANIEAARVGYHFTHDNAQLQSPYKLKSNKDSEHLLITGNEAIALGAIAAGCKFMAAYPMTPASSIMEYIAAKSHDYGLVMVHAEDEIAAINMVIGASYAGTRAMTATSGSGFCLMVEGLGLAGITETPIVIINAQRPGPATGLPTRTEQSDLEFMLYASHGEFPRAVLAPTTIENNFWITVSAFNLAERYQIPVIILTDQHLASSYSTVAPFDLSKVIIDRGTLFSENNRNFASYKRHQITDSGISPRAFPGIGRALTVTDADEHDADGHLTEDAAIRNAMMKKRLRKFNYLNDDEIESVILSGKSQAKITLIGWGSTFGSINEAREMLQNKGLDVNHLHFNKLWPFPAEKLNNILQSTALSFVIENNASGQLAHLIRAETGRSVNGRILKYDGRPFAASDITPAVLKEVENHDINE